MTDELRALKKIVKEKEIHEKFMLKLLEDKTEENFKLRQELDKLKNDKTTSRTP
tara:strand:+ start:353 stop:514 length:162 start_codon:yes stop_codon:yes gene_type:complete